MDDKIGGDGVQQSIGALTNGAYNELRCNFAGEIVRGNFMSSVCTMLSKCGIDIQDRNVYDEVAAAAVTKFQQMVGMKSNGILDDNTWKAMIYYSAKMSDIIDEESEDAMETGQEKSSDPHYNPFFDDGRFKLHRQNNKDIKIVFGNNSITKTIKDVFMRGVSLEVDTSGNPISEIYEFVARDLKESDEIGDAFKYT